MLDTCKTFRKQSILNKWKDFSGVWKRWVISLCLMIYCVLNNITFKFFFQNNSEKRFWLKLSPAIVLTLGSLVDFLFSFELIFLKPPSFGVEFLWAFLFSLSLSDEVSHSFGFAFKQHFLRWHGIDWMFHYKNLYLIEHVEVI